MRVVHKSVAVAGGTPVVSQALRWPCVAAHVPLAAKPDSPGSAGGSRLPMSCQVWPSSVRRTGKRPFTESTIMMALFASQNAKQSKNSFASAPSS